MNGEMTKKQSPEQLEQSHAAMLKEALSRPGVREMIEVYTSWQEQNHALDSYRSVTTEVGIISVTDHANAS